MSRSTITSKSSQQSLAPCRYEAQLIALEQGQAAAPAEEKGMARVNKLNKARNFRNAFENVGARPEGARTADDGIDPFSRRKTRPMNYWNTNKQKGGGSGVFLGHQKRALSANWNISVSPYICWLVWLIAHLTPSRGASCAS